MPKVKSLSFNSAGAAHIKPLGEAGFEVSCMTDRSNVADEDFLISELADYDAIVAGAETYSNRVLRALPKLRAIVRSGVGYDAIHLPTTEELGIVVATTPGVNHHAVAEHTIAMLMGVARGFPDCDRNVREDRWVRTARPRVMGSTIGVVGLGRIGQAVATRAIGLGMKVARRPCFSASVLTMNLKNV